METINTTCKHCNNEFNQRKVSEKYLKVFCTRSCAASYNNKLKERVCNYKKSATCIQCNTDFLYFNSKGLYCSNKCHKDHLFLDKVESVSGVMKSLAAGVMIIFTSASSLINCLTRMAIL